MRFIVWFPGESRGKSLSLQVKHTKLEWAALPSPYLQLNPTKGANSPLGIGRASAHQFAHNGAAALFICDYSDQNLSAHARELQSLYPSCETHARRFDAADEGAVKAVVDEALEKYGRLDIMFANAGVVGTNRVFTDVGAEEVMKTLRTNVLSVFLAAKYAALAMG